MRLLIPILMNCMLVLAVYLADKYTPIKKMPYAAKQTARQCKILPAAVFKALYEHCVETEYAIKSGRMRDTAALEAILIKIASARLASSRN